MKLTKGKALEELDKQLSDISLFNLDEMNNFL